MTERRISLIMTVGLRFSKGTARTLAKVIRFSRVRRAPGAQYSSMGAYTSGQSGRPSAANHCATSERRLTLFRLARKRGGDLCDLLMRQVAGCPPFEEQEDLRAFFKLLDRVNGVR